MKHLVLIGFMGSGKSTVGKALAKQLLLPFVDLDETIELQQNLSIARIFSDFGEDHFRNLESASLLKALAAQGCHIIATGGGVILRPGNRQLLKDSARCLFLDAPPDVFLPRIRSDPSLRPLAQQASDQELIQRWQERLPLYLEIAEHRIDAARDILTIVQSMKEYLKSKVFRSDP